MAKDPVSGDVTHNSVSNLKLDNSQVTLDDSQGFQTLTIYENLSGNGHFDLNTDLANQQSDKIVVKGDDSGNFTLGIKDSGNEPNAANGKVTFVETQTGQAQFSLKDRDYVDAGAYRYRLNKEGTNWILANRQAESVTNTPVQPTPPAKPVTPAPTEPTPPVVVQPTQPQPTQPSQPVVAPVLKALSEKTNALVSLRQAQGALLSQNLQGIHQRLGELKTDKLSNVWVKNNNSRSEAKAQNVAVDSRSSSFEMDSHSLQLGADRAINDNLRLGGFVGASRADVDFNGEYSKGKLRSQAVGLYATFANEQGWYLDNIAKYEHLTAKFVDEKRKYNGFSLSSEIGKRFALSNDWSVTPQAQLAYHTINGKADESRLNLFTARAGVRVAKGFALNNGWNLQPYAEVNAIAEKANNAKVRVNQYQFDVAENKGRVQTALGLTAGNSNHRLGLEASVTSGSKFKQPLSVLANYRYQW
ncbi:autotransporter outer membrane beta-barrel domain-containing protein [Mannheimia sp. E30BD]|uniref:autotransporter outer membrane beta-barrel domain-containing protein n=1 Tax=Mannheimia sp. E30BD TaxID=3278708 RepID=UPI00359E4BA0